MVPTGSVEVAVAGLAAVPMVPVPSKLDVPWGTGGRTCTCRSVTEPEGWLVSALALFAVTVAVKVTDWPEVEGFGVEVRPVVVP